MRSFLVLVGFAIGIVGYAIVYDGAAAVAGDGSKAFPWGKVGIMNSLVPGREGSKTQGGAGGSTGIPATPPGTDFPWWSGLPVPLSAPAAQGPQQMQKVRYV